MTIIRPLIALGSLFLLTGCFMSNLGRLESIAPEADDFPSSLASEYLAYAQSQSEEGHVLSAEHFARKGRRAYHEKLVPPEVVADTLPEPLKSQLAASRDLLITLLTDDMKRVAPQKSARAQLLFDCWEHQSEEDASAPALCADEFQSALVELQKVAGDFSLGQTQNYEFHFTDTSLALSAADSQTIKTIAASLSAAKRYRIELEGYAGKGASVRQLAAKRMAIVRRALVAQGLHSSHIQILSRNTSKAVHLSCEVTAEPSDKNLVKAEVRIFDQQGAGS